MKKNFLERLFFSLFIRTRSKNRPFFLFAGLDPFLKLLKNFKFKEKDLEYLESLKIFKKNFLIILKIFLLKVLLDVFLKALYFFEGEPICEVESDLISAQIIETLIINKSSYRNPHSNQGSFVCNGS